MLQIAHPGMARKGKDQHAADVTPTPFLDALASAEHRAGVYLFREFVTPTEADRLFEMLNDDTNIPWDLKPVIGGERLTSHACLFKRKEKEIRKWSGAPPLLFQRSYGHCCWCGPRPTPVDLTTLAHRRYIAPVY